MSDPYARYACAARTALFALALLGCGASQPEPGLHTPMPDAHDPAYAASFDGTTDERVSTSRGEEGGIVVLWPRVAPADQSGSAAAATLHDSLAAAARQAGSSRPVDVRPRPQRVCPSAGCLAAAVGAVLIVQQDGCAAAATVSLPGRSPARIVPWAGEVELRSTVAPFREPPESQVRVTDFVPCSELSILLESNAPTIVEAIGEVVRD